MPLRISSAPPRAVQSHTSDEDLGDIRRLVEQRQLHPTPGATAETIASAVEDHFADVWAQLMDESFGRRPNALDINADRRGIEVGANRQG
ncbi:hypothetical protein [Nocardia amamiensis]|uniref:hypothetical protein n=1 Tax=Nocardia amamiensis TaxID=404578 RepID=UPI001894C896|nr:hypothetical protein [Nocardia amamiensis]